MYRNLWISSNFLEHGCRTGSVRVHGVLLPELRQPNVSRWTHNQKPQGKMHWLQSFRTVSGRSLEQGAGNGCSGVRDCSRCNQVGWLRLRANPPRLEPRWQYHHSTTHPNRGWVEILGAKFPISKRQEGKSNYCILLIFLDLTLPVFQISEVLVPDENAYQDQYATGHLPVGTPSDSSLGEST